MTTSAEAPQQSQGTETPIKTKFALDSVFHKNKQSIEADHAARLEVENGLNNFFMTLLEKNWLELIKIFPTAKTQEAKTPQVPQEWEILLMEQNVKQVIEFLYLCKRKKIAEYDLSTAEFLNQIKQIAVRLGWCNLRLDPDSNSVTLTEKGEGIAQEYSALLHSKEKIESAEAARVQEIQGKIRQGMQEAGLFQNTQNDPELTAQDAAVATAE